MLFRGFLGYELELKRKCNYIIRFCRCTNVCTANHTHISPFIAIRIPCRPFNHQVYPPLVCSRCGASRYADPIAFGSCEPCRPPGVNAATVVAFSAKLCASVEEVTSTTDPTAPCSTGSNFRRVSRVW